MEFADVKNFLIDVNTMDIIKSTVFQLELDSIKTTVHYDHFLCHIQHVSRIVLKIYPFFVYVCIYVCVSVNVEQKQNEGSGMKRDGVKVLNNLI